MFGNIVELCDQNVMGHYLQVFTKIIDEVLVLDTKSYFTKQLKELFDQGKTTNALKKLFSTSKSSLRNKASCFSEAIESYL